MLYPYRFFAELVKEVISDLEDSKYQKAEFRGRTAHTKPFAFRPAREFPHDIRSENVQVLTSCCVCAGPLHGIAFIR